MHDRAGDLFRLRQGATVSAAARACLAAGIAATGAGLILNMPTRVVQAPEIRLVDVEAADSALGGGTALVLGASEIPTPTNGFADAIDALYLAPRDFTGAIQAVTTPESLYPFTGPFTETFDASTTTGEQALDQAITTQLQAGGVDAANPIVITGYSQSATLESLLMPQLEAQHVPADDLHFILLGDPSAPNGGLLERFDLPAGTTSVEAPSLGLTFSGATPSDLFPTDIYTYEYDGFADFPKYPINFLSDINAYLGILFNHSAYLGLTPDQISDAVQLPTSSTDAMTNYYMITSDSLPLLDPLRLIPGEGNPLADLLQPDLSVLVNLGYGSITDGWSPGYADVPTTMATELLPPESVLVQVPEALVQGLQQGLNDAMSDLTNPSNYQLISPETMTDVLGPLLNAGESVFDLDASSSPYFSTDLSNELTGVENWFVQGLSEISSTHTGLPSIDMASTALTTLPQIAEQLYAAGIAAGDPLDAIGDPLALVTGLAPLMLAGALF